MKNKLEVKLEEIIKDVEKYNQKKYLALVGDNAYLEYNRLRDYIPNNISVIISNEEDLFTREAYCIDLNYVEIKK